MKISTENNIRRFDKPTYKVRIQGMDAGLASVRRNCDQIIIGSGTPQMEEKKIAAEAASRVSREVRTPTSQERIESLKQQVREGTYRPDPEEIVSRMLLEKGYMVG
ncbi:MAG: flagellar biosynthesis anti-sigma factor FlgM [Ruminococcus sp.]|nr:flagellar biosynthesis anti-sigma factor FlgM [Ruminococcus sp.]